MALARKIVSGDEITDSETVEDAFALARQAEIVSEELLVDDGWKALEVEPETVAVNGNGTNGNGDSHGPDIFGPTVELVPANGHHANGNGANGNGANGNGHHDEAEEPERLLFSWAEFMAEETVKPKRRRRKPQPATVSMFEWAVELERERETVGAGR